MKQMLIYILMLVNLFIDINPMEKTPKILVIPNEIKLYIFELLMKNIIENNNIFEPFNNVKETINNISLTHPEFNNLKSDLINFARKYMQNYFADIYINLSQEGKDAKLEDIFLDIDINHSKELEIEAAKLIIAGANPNLRIDYNACLSDATLLMIIARSGKFKKLIKLLIGHGININAQNNYGYTALTEAICIGHKNIAELLIAEGANVDIQNSHGFTILMWAEIEGHTAMVKLLIGANADVNMQDNSGYTVLMGAARRNYREIAELLIDAGADVDIKDNGGYTALIDAATCGHTDIVNLLIDVGADVDAQNNNGYTALILATKLGYRNIVKLLIDAGADINITNKDGKTALMYAIDNEDAYIIELLKANRCLKATKCLV